MMKLLSFDVGGTFIKWALLDELTVIKQGKVPTPKTNFEDYLQALKSVKDQIDEAIIGLAFSLPGTIDKSRGYIIQGGSLAYNANREYQKEVEEFFLLPVSLENDSKSACICEKEIGELKGIENGAMIVLGTGIGCTFVLDGKIHHGSHNSAGEISIYLAGNVFQERFGSFLAEKCSTVSMVRIAQDRLQDPQLDGIQLMKLVAEGNPIANEILDECQYELAKAIFNIQTINDLDKVVIGGGISADPLYIERLKKTLNRFYEEFPFPIANHLILSRSAHGNDANLLGAAITFYQEHPDVFKSCE